MRKEIGKIKSIRFGFGGYQDAQIGIAVTLGGKSWGVSDFKGAWINDPSEDAKWTAEQRIKFLGETVLWASKLMQEANVSSLDELTNIPVEVTFDGMTLKEWRILTEVI